MIRRLLFILILFFASHCYALDPVMQQIMSEGKLCADWAGAPESSGTPSAPIGSYADYEQTADRVYAETWTAAENGLITHVNIRYGEEVNFGANGAWLVVYVNGTKVGQYEDGSPVASTWTGEQVITVVSGQSLSFKAGDTVVFGLGFDGAGTNGGISYDAGGAAQLMVYDSTVTVGATGPDATCSFSNASTAHAGASILRYNKACP